MRSRIGTTRPCAACSASPFERKDRCARGKASASRRSTRRRCQVALPVDQFHNSSSSSNHSSVTCRSSSNPHSRNYLATTPPMVAKGYVCCAQGRRIVDSCVLMFNMAALQTEGSMVPEFERTASPSSRHQSQVYPLSGGYAGGMGSDMNQSPSGMGQSESTFDYVPMQSSSSSQQRMRSNSASQSSMMQMNMMHSYPPQYSPHPQQASPMYANSPSAFSNDPRGLFPGTSPQGTSPMRMQVDRERQTADCLCSSHVALAGPPQQQQQQYRMSEPPINVPHKRIIDEIQGGQRDSWKNDSPVSVTARIFRPTPQQQSQQQQQQHPHSPAHDALGNNSPVSMSMQSPMNAADSFKASVPSLYRPAPTSMSHFANMDQVWANGCM